MRVPPGSGYCSSKWWIVRHGGCRRWSPVRWEFLGFAGIIHPGAKRTGAPVALEQKQHVAHVVSKLACFDLCFPCLPQLLFGGVGAALNVIAVSCSSDPRGAFVGPGPRSAWRGIREQLGTRGYRSICLAGRRCPDHDTVGQLLVPPSGDAAVKCLQPVVLPNV